MTAVTTHLPEPLSQDMMQYEVRSRAEVVALLRALEEGRVLVTAYFGEEEFLVTNVLAVDADRGKLVCGLGNVEAINRRLIASGEIVFVAILEQVKMQFWGTSAQRSRYLDADAFSVDLPQTVLRLQRREYFRVPTPQVRPVVCTVAAPGSKSARVELQILEISVGGVGALVDPEKLRAERGMLLQDGELRLPGGETVRVALDVRHTSEAMRGGHRRLRLGCRFVGLRGADTASLQRYVDRLQREWLARH